MHHVRRTATQCTCSICLVWPGHAALFADPLIAAGGAPLQGVSPSGSTKMHLVALGYIAWDELQQRVFHRLHKPSSDCCFRSNLAVMDSAAVISRCSPASNCPVCYYLGQALTAHKGAMRRVQVHEHRRPIFPEAQQRMLPADACVLQLCVCCRQPAGQQGSRHSWARMQCCAASSCQMCQWG